MSNTAQACELILKQLQPHAADLGEAGEHVFKLLRTNRAEAISGYGSYAFDNSVREWSYTMQKLNQQDLDRNFSLATTHLVKWMQAKGTQRR